MSGVWKLRLLADIPSIGSAMRGSDVQLVVVDASEATSSNVECGGKDDFRVNHPLRIETTNPGTSPPCSPYASFAINAQSIAKSFRWESLSQRIDKHASIRQDPIVVVVRMNLVYVGICQK